MLLLLLFATGLFAGTVDAIAGGGGLISLPVLLSVGVPPHLALGTNKFQSTIGTFMAARKYYQHGFISLKSCYLGIVFGLIGAISGAVVAQVLSSDILHAVVPVLLGIILIYTLFSPVLGKTDRLPRIHESVFYIIFGFSLAFYDGFFGPGVGSFWVVALSFFLGYNLIKATAYTKIFNLNSNVVAAVCFALGGNIDYRFALSMAAGQLIGGRLGAYLAIKKGASLIRPLFLTMVTFTLFSLVSKQYLSHENMARLMQSHLLASSIIAVTTMAVFVGMYYRRHMRKMQV